MKLRRTLIDNSPEGYNMTEVLKECLKDKNVSEVYIATGFWDLRGTALVYDELVEFLSREGCKFRLLIGKDPYLYSSDTESFTKGRYDKQEQAWRVDLDKFCAQEQYVKVVQMLVDNLKDKNSEKFQIHIYNPDGELKDQFLHSKCYIFKGYDHEDECNVGYGIIGSTNFTQKGLEGNSELNTLEVNARDVISLDPEFKRDKTHLLWFNEKWENSVSWEEEFLLQITLSKMATDITIPEPETAEAEQPFTPNELYIKLLQTYFGDIIDKNLGEQIEAYLPQKMICLQFQIEAVKRCLSIMHEHGGFMLADVVGLGKTIIGTLVIKRFLTVPEDDGRERRVLIVTPPAIKSGWVKTIESFDKDSDDRMMPKIDFITTGRIGVILDDTEDEEEADEDEGRDTGEFTGELSNTHYGLIIIDESHKFRNSNTLMYQALDDLIGLIGAETGTYPYIGLLSATPQNNRPNDLKNQIYLFERNHTDSTLKKARSGNIESFFADADSEYRLLIRRDSDIPKEERRARLRELSRQIRDCVLSDILVRRTRTDVVKYYAADIEAKGLRFPKTIGPKKLEYILDSELSRLFSDTMTLVAPTEEEMMRGVDYLGYYRYRAIEFFKDEESKRKYEGRGNRSAEAVANQLADIMQMLLVKRLESSFAAFTQSLLNLRRYTENMIRMWEKNVIFVCPDIDINNELDTKAKTEKRGKPVTIEDCFEDIRKKIAKLNSSGRNERGQNAEYSRNDFDAEYEERLRNDFELINQLCERWARNTEDPKFDSFKENLRPVFFNAETNTSCKLVIFSEAIDTVKALTRAVQAKGYRVLEITAKNRHEMEDTIAANFDANYDKEWKNDYDVIITTEVLAEGINLHRANVIINYDTPWNSTRLMQRIGRVNRVGSKEPFVYVYNFFPSAEGDAEISLVQKAYTKLQSFHILFGEDNKVFTDEEEVMQYEQAAIIDDGESPMEQYVFELKQYREEHPQRFELIEATEDQWEIASYLNGNAYFLIKAPRSSHLAVIVPNDADEKPRIISSIEMLEALQVAEETQSTPLPENWVELSKAALLAYNQYFVRINKSRAGTKGAEAKEVLHKLQQNSSLTHETKSLLNSARRLIDQGNYDLVKKILTLREYLEDTQGQLFEVGNEDINQLIEREIAKLVAKVEAKQGQAGILLGTVR